MYDGITDCPKTGRITLFKCRILIIYGALWIMLLDLEGMKHASITTFLRLKKCDSAMFYL